MRVGLSLDLSTCSPRWVANSKPREWFYSSSFFVFFVFFVVPFFVFYMIFVVPNVFSHLELVGSEVDQEAVLESRRFKIAEGLSFMLGREVFDRLQFADQRVFD